MELKFLFLSLLTCATVPLSTGRRIGAPQHLSMQKSPLMNGGRSKEVLRHRRSLNIARGDPVTTKRFPYSMLLAFKGKDGLTQICAGVLFKEQWGITAASCAEHVDRVNKLSVGIGTEITNPTSLIKNENAKIADDIVIHPKFNGRARDGSDLALVRISRSHSMTFPELADRDAILGSGMRLVTLGWGVSEKLQMIDNFQYTERDACLNHLPSYNKFTATIDDTVICAMPPMNNGEDSVTASICKGDEGAPLVFLDFNSFNKESVFVPTEGDPEKDVVHGIASHGPDCGTFGFNVYTKLAEYKDWIMNTTDNYVPPPPSYSGTAKTDMLRLGLMAAIPICMILLTIVLCVLIINCGYRPFKPRSSSSVYISSATALTQAGRQERRHDQTALMNMSPFLASSTLETVPSGMELVDCDSPVGVCLPTNIEVTLVGRKIGSGAFGRVEEGIYEDETGVRHAVAVKSVEIDEAESRQSLLNEIRVFERVGPHPNIVRCFGGRLHSSVIDETGYYIIEELMMTDLGKFFKNLKNRKRVTFGDYLRIFYEIANGLEHLHECEIIHFDLKPGNILLDENWCPKLADFGCSRKRAHSYITAGARGTMAYMAPELWLLGLYTKRAQVRGEKIDVFSFGVVMWESITNQNPVDPLGAHHLIITENGISDAAESELSEETLGTNEDFRTDRFPFDSATCPQKLMELIWDCVSYYNTSRPSFHQVKARITELTQKQWTHQNIDQLKP